MKRGNPANRLETALKVLASEHLPVRFNRSQYQREHWRVIGKTIGDSAALKHLWALRDGGYIRTYQQGEGNAQNVYTEQISNAMHSKR